MDQQLKERLVGAAVLVALTAIFVPMVLDGPAPPPAPVAATLAPAPVDASTFGYDLTAPLPGAPAAPHAGADTTTGTPASAPAMTAAASVALKTAMPNATEPKAAAPKVAAAAPAPTVAAPRTSTAATNSGGWAAQVGSFSKEATAKAIAADLKRRGFKAFVMEHREGGKTLYRVRVGPVATREAADVLGSKITQQTGQAARPVRHP